jgi:amino acid adenylation domain-containing protein
MQAGLVSDQRLSLDRGTDVIQVEAHMERAIEDVVAFQRTWAEVVQRHDTLRTAFRWRDDGRVEQWVADRVDLPWRIIDEGDLGSFLAEDRVLGFDLERPPLVRCALVGDRSLVFTFQHAVLDGRSLHLLFQEVFDRYNKRHLTTGMPPPYRRFIEWLEARGDTGDEAFWRSELAGFTDPTILSGCGTGTARGAHAEHDLRLPEEVSDRMRALAAAHGLTLNTIFQGAWALLLSSCTGQEDVSFGAIRSVRRGTILEAERMIGLFLNTLPVRVRVDGDRPVLDVLRDLRRQALSAREHQHASLMQVKRWAGTPPGRPLFDTLLVFENQVLRLPGCSFRLHRQPNYPMAVSVFAEPSVLVKLVHDRSRFEGEQVAALASRLHRIVLSLADDPARLVKDLPLLDENERHRVLVEWNATAAPYLEIPVHRQVAAHAAAHPNAPAVAEMSYGELNRRANRLAHGLGTGKGDIVAIRIPRGPALVAAELGVLKTGAAYLPLDPEFPPQRVDAMLRDAGVRAVLTEGDVEAHQGPDHDPDIEVRPDDVAYVIYTSGSTGAPKGVMIPHRGVANLAAWMARAHGITSADRMTLVASPAFDASVLEIWPCLAAGASLHLPDEDTLLTPTALARWLTDEEITATFLPTGLAELVLDQSWPPGGALRLMTVGGDRLHRPVRMDLPFALYNLYGPTEYSVVATSDLVDLRGGPALPPIGRPIANTRTYLLDSRQDPVPVGTPGELYLAGDGLALGYLGRPELTAERFVVNSLTEARMYRTGDLCRQRPDGRLEFLGRADRQMKVRGFRVEPGEIEAVLRTHPAVLSTAVVPTGTGNLAAFVVSDAATPEELRGYLRERLPAHMVPAVLSLVPRIPLTANGKVDRGAMPVPAGGASANLLYSRIASVWAEVLGTVTPGEDDDFFALGGHSLHAVAASLRLSREFDVEVPARLIFEAPTLAAFGDRLAELRRAGSRPVSPIRRLRRGQ